MKEIICIYYSSCEINQNQQTQQKWPTWRQCHVIGKCLVNGEKYKLIYSPLYSNQTVVMLSSACMEEDKYIKTVFYPGPFPCGIISI